MVLLFAWITAHAGTVDDYASRPGWACMFNQDRTLCVGEDTLKEVEASHSVSICGEDICAESWHASVTGPERDAAAVAWAGAVQDEYRHKEWTVVPAKSAQNWRALMRTPSRIISIELGEDSVILRDDPRPFCDNSRLMKHMHPYLVVVAGSIEVEWPAIAASEIPKGITASVIEEAVASLAGEHPPDVAQRLFLGSDEFACFQRSHRAKSTMDVVRIAVDQWNIWSNPTPKELRIREKEERKRAKAQNTDRDVEATDVEEFPEELIEDLLEETEEPDDDFLEDILNDEAE